jgi:hypothetical protein
MKTLLFISILVFFSSFSVLSQTDETSNCPIINLLGPAGIVAPNETATYLVTLDMKGQELKLEYIWSISESEILQGQGTKSISVKQPLSQSLTVTIEIKGFPEGCSNTFSENAIYDPSPVSEKIDEFPMQTARIDKARIDNFLNELQNDPNAQGYIIEKFKKITPKATIKNKLKKLFDYIVKTRGFDPSRIKIIQNSDEENLTQFWLIPPGAEYPTL